MVLRRLFFFDFICSVLLEHGDNFFLRQNIVCCPSAGSLVARFADLRLLFPVLVKVGSSLPSYPGVVGREDCTMACATDSGMGAFLCTRVVAGGLQGVFESRWTTARNPV